jgi:hypothetical protein
LFDTRRPLLNQLNAAGTAGRLSGCVTALRSLRDAEYSFNVAVRKIAVDNSVMPDVNAMLRDSNTLITIDDGAVKAPTFAKFTAMWKKALTVARRLGEEEITVGADLDVMTDHPTTHLTPATLPDVVKPYQSHLFGSEGNSSINAGYKNGIYRMRIAQPSGSIDEDLLHPVNVADTTVSADVYLLGKATTAFVSCRNSGSGTHSGTGYYLGITSDGTWYIQRVDTDAQQVVNLASGFSSVIHTGNNAKNSFLADCAGHYLTLFANSMPIFQVYDDTLSSGNVGVGASVFPGPGEVVLGNFTASGSRA